FDQGSNFNTNGTFTAPVTGRYRFSAAFRVSAITAAMTNASMSFLTSNISTINFGYCDPSVTNNVLTQIGLTGSALLDMDAADIANVRVVVSNGAGNTAQADGSAGGLLCFFCGELAC
ncbi:MAG TPA: hypothetical protein VMV86_05875, partial [Methanosarcinales archaeon]|nr:hypothetical protein [Methanosarcinales archaeon]